MTPGFMRAERRSEGRRAVRRPTLIYIHIPKTAGTTLMGVLKANYGRRFHRVENRGGWRDFQKWHPLMRSKVRCLTGHMPWGMHIALQRRYYYATMLREPTDRVLSLYYYIRSRPSHTRYKLAQRCDVVDFVKSGIVSDTDNGMVRFLSGRPDVGIRRRDSPANEADLERAKINLEAFAAVGFVEAFDQSLAMFARVFGWENLNAGRQRMLDNRRNRQDASLDVLEVVTEANRLDWDLYRWAGEQFYAGSS